MRRSIVSFAAGAILVGACHRAPTAVIQPTRLAGTAVPARDTVAPDYFEAAGVANPVEQATLSTRLAATVIAVNVVEGARVRRGDLLVRLDANDLAAQRRQAAAAIDEATTMRDLARVTATRMQAMFADSAAPRAQLDAANAALARAESQVAAARERIAEVDAAAQYAEIRAPFDGQVTRRLVDPGAFAAPGTPLVTLQATDRLRVSAAIPAAFAASLRTGARVAMRLEAAPVDGVIEGVVPSAGNLYVVNAMVDNRGGRYLAGSAATIFVPTGSRHMIFVPRSALVHQGDLVGVHRRLPAGDELIWVTIGAGMTASDVEIRTGLAPGDLVVVPVAPDGSR